MMRDHAENQSDIKRHQCHQRSVFKKNHANWSNDSKNLDGCNLKGCSVFKSPFNELEDERKPRRELSWILRDIREPSWGLLKQNMAKIVPNCQKKRWRLIVTFWKNVFASCWILDSVLTSVVDFGNFLAPSTTAFYPLSPATPCMTIFIYSMTILGKHPPAWPGPNWPKMPILGQIWSFLGKKSFFYRRNQKFCYPHNRKPK